jgi:hypothetical protein
LLWEKQSGNGDRVSLMPDIPRKTKTAIEGKSIAVKLFDFN